MKYVILFVSHFKNKTDCPVLIILLLFWLPMLFNVSVIRIYVYISTEIYKKYYWLVSKECSLCSIML